MTISSTSLHGLSDTPEVRKQLGNYLLSKGLISPIQLEVSLAEQSVTNEKLGRILTRNGFLTQKSLLEAVLHTNPERIQGDTLYSAKVPEEVLSKCRTMVVAETEDTAYLSTFGSERQVLLDLKPYYPNHDIVFVPANFEQVDNYLEDLKAAKLDEGSLVDRLLRNALLEGASDLHILPRHNSYTVFYRQLGKRRHVHEGTLAEYNTLAARIKDLSKMDLAERRVNQDGAFQYEHNNKLVDLRVATIPVNGAEYLVIRVLDSDRVQPVLTGLGITRVREWMKGISRPEGLCLICGPTGQGKTTTLTATVREMDRFGKAIFSLEDPVEFRTPFLGQVSINPLVGLDFASGVRALMRMDPDVIIIGEIRDAETALNAIKAADTGHLVIGTMHTGSILGTLQRLKHLNVPTSDILHLLRSVLVQGLIRTSCPDCHGAGCSRCFNTGYTSRTVISECAYFSSEVDVQELIDGKRSWPTLMEDAIDKYRNGITTKAEVLSKFGEEARSILEAEDINAVV